MCGVVGFVDYSARRDDDLAAVVRAMTDRMRHRGPDDEGSWTSRLGDESALVFGHRRLSILDLSAEGHQPMRSASGRFVITFNGEIYNFRQMRRELTGAGHSFRGGSDTEVMLAAFEEWGVRAALDRFVGMFAFGLWDALDETLYLVRDRLGIKPLYYGWLGSSFVFASELCALTAHPDFAADVDPRALSLYFRYLCVPAPFSIQRGIEKLSPGEMFVFRPRDLRGEPERYWDLSTVVEEGARDPFRGSETEALERLDALICDAVKGRMEADVPLGALLSGGIDSTAVVAAMAQVGSHDLKTYSIGFEDPDHDESEAAAQVAKHLGTEHTELFATTRQAIDTVPNLATMYDEPFADSSQIPTFLVSRLAREHVVVALSGDGGDEQFVGYDRYALGERLWPRLARVPYPLRSVTGAAIRAFPLGGWNVVTKLARRLGLLSSQGAITAQSAHTFGHLLACEDEFELWREIVSIWRNPDQVGGETAPTWPPTPSAGGVGLGVARAMMLMDGLLYLPDDVLTKVDRASMNVSLEVRVPLLDHRVVEFTSSLPLDLRRRGATRKWLLREFVYRRVPRKLVDRPKRGFSVPLAAWLKGPLRDWAEPLLGREALESSGLRSGEVRRMWKEHCGGRRNWEHQLWTVLMYQAWRAGSDASPARS